MSQLQFPFMDPGNDAKMMQMMGMSPRTPSGQMLFPFMAGAPALDAPRQSAAVPQNVRAKPDPRQPLLPGMEDAFDLDEDEPKKKKKGKGKGKGKGKTPSSGKPSALPKAVRRGGFLRMLPGLGLLGVSAGFLLNEANRRRSEDNARMSQMRMMAAMGSMSRFGQNVQLGQGMGEANRINMAANIMNSINIPNPADAELAMLLGAQGNRAAQAAAVAPSMEERGMAFANALT